MSQALRDAIASVRRVSGHQIDERPSSRRDEARHDPPPFDDDLADEQASFDAGGTEERPSIDEYAPHDEPPSGDAGAGRWFDDQARYEEPPLADRVADAQLPFGDRPRWEGSSIGEPAADAQPPFGDDAADAQPLFDDGEREDWPHGQWQESVDRLPLWREVTRRRSLHFGALAVAIAFVLLAGFGFGVLSGAQDLDRLVAAFGWTPQADETVAAPQADPAPSSTSPSPSSGGGVARPAEPEKGSPQLSELETVRVAPLPGTQTIERSPDPTANFMPLPPPPKPAFRSSLLGEGPPASDRINGVVDDAVDAAAVALLEADGAGGPFEPILVKTPVSGPRVLVHYTESAPGGPATALHLVRRLKAAGFTVEGRGVQFPIPKHSVRYFFDTDRDEAEAVSAELEGQIPGNAALPVLDFTNYEPKPREGHLEVWLGR